MTAPGPSRGRPPATSRSTLQEAAFELFLERGYARTNVEQIAARAGVSRATFFNHFEAKSDVFWVEVDDRLDRLVDLLGQVPGASGTNAIATISTALRRVAENAGSTSVTWLFAQTEATGAQHELQASALSRFARFTGIVTRFITRMHPDASPVVARTVAFAAAGAVIAAADQWASAGIDRGDLGTELERAMEPVRTLGTHVFTEPA